MIPAGPNVSPDPARDVAGGQGDTDPLVDLIAHEVHTEVYGLDPEQEQRLAARLAAVVRAAGTTGSGECCGDGPDGYCCDCPAKPAMSGVTPGNPTHDVLRDYALGKIEHRFMGECPDARIDHNEDARDPECPVCRALDAPSPAPGDQQAETELENARLTREQDQRYIRRVEGELETLRALFPCDGGCNYGDGPIETCTRHGRGPAELWTIIDQVQTQRDTLRTAIETLRDEIQPLTTVAAAWLDLRLGDALDGKA